ncbi:MAG: hypothetical protein AB2A00_33245 [Myxococcota bacterium]
MRRWALVTDGTGSLGHTYARLLARCGYNLLLVSDEPARLTVVATEIRHRQGVEVRELPVGQGWWTGMGTLLDAVREERNLHVAFLGKDTFALPRCLSGGGPILLTASSRRRLIRAALPNLVMNRGALVQTLELPALWTASGRRLGRLGAALLECTTRFDDAAAVRTQWLCVGRDGAGARHPGFLPSSEAAAARSWEQVQSHGGTCFASMWHAPWFAAAVLLSGKEDAAATRAGSSGQPGMGSLV